MVSHGTHLRQLKLIQENPLSQQEADIVDAYNYAVQSSTPEAADEVAWQIDAMCPPLSEANEARDYFWFVWQTMLNVARSPDVDIKIHGDLVRIVESLSQCAKGELSVWGVTVRVWKDLPLFPACMDAYFIDPHLEYEQNGIPPEAAQIWRNMSAFGARCLGAGVAGPYTTTMDALRLALEEDQGVTELRIQVACIWISHGAKPLLRWAYENIGYVDVPVEDTAAWCESGSLYHGPATMCLQRWGFWQERFEEFGKSESGLSKDVQAAALEAVETMKRVERAIGNTL